MITFLFVAITFGLLVWNYRLRKRYYFTLKDLKVSNEDLKLAEAEKYLDSLSGTYTRSGFDYIAPRAYAQQKRDHKSQNVVIAFIDLDNFKSINDTLGHQAGDLAIKLLGEILLENFRQSDTVGRYGGDEFVIMSVMTEGKVADIHKKIVKIRKQYEEVVESNIYLPQQLERPDSVSLSFGIAVHDKNSDDNNLSDLIKEADKNLYLHKQKRRDQNPE